MKTDLKELKAKISELKAQAIAKTATYLNESRFETKRANIQRGKVVAYENVELLIDEMLKNGE